MLKIICVAFSVFILTNNMPIILIESENIYILDNISPEDSFCITFENIDDMDLFIVDYLSDKNFNNNIISEYDIYRTECYFNVETNEMFFILKINNIFNYTVFFANLTDENFIIKSSDDKLSDFSFEENIFSSLCKLNKPILSNYSFNYGKCLKYPAEKHNTYFYFNSKGLLEKIIENNNQEFDSNILFHYNNDKLETIDYYFNSYEHGTHGSSGKIFYNENQSPLGGKYYTTSGSHFYSYFYSNDTNKPFIYIDFQTMAFLGNDDISYGHLFEVYLLDFVN